jgi:hypothetical protein
MNRELTINVNVNPNGQPQPTETQVSTTPQQEETSRRFIERATLVTVGTQIARRGARIVAANIGDLTGNKTLARNVQGFSSVVLIGAVAFKNPVIAGVLLASQFASATVSNVLEIRNQNFQIDYNRKIRTAVHNNGRRQ